MCTPQHNRTCVVKHTQTDAHRQIHTHTHTHTTAHKLNTMEQDSSRSELLRTQRSTVSLRPSALAESIVGIFSKPPWVWSLGSERARLGLSVERPLAS